MPAAHAIYAEQLRDLRRGYPLYYPEPRHEGPVEIGDVGYTKDGAFRRLFNASRPADDPVQRFGVPGDFVPLDLGAIDVFDAALEPGPLHSRTISTLSTEIGTPGEILPAEASFRFSCSSKRGAILMLETQMMREEAIQSRHIEAYVVQHCRSWHAFARDLGMHIGFGDLMLVTECSKTAAWSSAVYSNSSTEFGLSFSVGMPFSTAGISASSSLEKIGPVERRRSQKRAQAHDQPLPKDHTVFIKAYRVGMRQMYYQSLVSIFTKARSPSLNQGDRGGIGSRSPSIGSSNSSPPSSPSVPSIIGPYEPDFHPSLALLALEMEKYNDSEFVILHDDVWCSMAPDSDGFRLMDDYTNFYFSDEVTSYLNSMLGEIPFDEDFPLYDMDESLLSYDPYLGSGYVVSDEQSMNTTISSPSEPMLELISPEISGEASTSHSSCSNDAGRYVFTDAAQAIFKTTNVGCDTTPNVASKNGVRFAHGVKGKSAHGTHSRPYRSHPIDAGQPSSTDRARAHSGGTFREESQRNRPIRGESPQPEPHRDLKTDINTYHTASEIPSVVWEALSRHSVDANVILPHALRFDPRPQPSYDQLWLVANSSVRGVSLGSCHSANIVMTEPRCSNFGLQSSYDQPALGTYRHGMWSTGPDLIYISPPVEDVANLVQRWMHFLGDCRLHTGEGSRWRSGVARRGPDTRKSWKIGLKNLNTLGTRRHLMARAYSMFAQMMSGESSGTSAEELGTLVWELWSSMSSEEREELCRILFGTVQAVEGTR